MRTRMVVQPDQPGLDMLVQARARAVTSTADACEATCGRCGRCLAVLTSSQPVPTRWLRAHLVTLDEQACCRWCARPITAEAEKAAPLDGYVRIARLTAREVARHHPAATMLE